MFNALGAPATRRLQSALNGVESAVGLLQNHQQRGISAANRNTVARRAAKKAAGTKRQGNYEYKPANIKSWSIFSGDLVQVKHGYLAGKVGRVTHVDRLNGQLYVSGLNYQRVLVKQASSLSQPYTANRRMPFLYDHVALVNPETKQGTTIVWKTLENGEKARYAKDTGALIPRAPYTRKPKSGGDSTVATVKEDARRITYEKHPEFLKVA